MVGARIVALVAHLSCLHTVERNSSFDGVTLSMVDGPKNPLLRRIMSEPARFLAYLSLAAALKRLRRDGEWRKNSLIVFIAPKGYRLDEYVEGLKDLDLPGLGDWETDTRRFYASAGRFSKLRKGESVPSVFELRDLRVAIFSHESEVPAELRFVAAAVVQLMPPNIRQIQSARRALGLELFTLDVARLLSQANQETIIAALYRPKVSASDLDLLKERKNANLIDVPSLHDLPGFGELKEWALSAVSKIASWRNGRLSWEEVGTGVLLAGPPGSGKTFCAASLARALGLDFLTVTVGGWQARGPLHSLLQAMRDDFAEAGTKNGLLLFLDEADSIGSRIASGSDDHYWRVVVNELLHQINILPDGVLLVLATNYPDMIDPALLRSGRIDNHFFIGFPDLQTRREILIFYVGTSIDPDRIYDLAVDLEGWSSAELAKKAQEAAMRAKQDGRDLTFQDIADVFPREFPILKLIYSVSLYMRSGMHWSVWGLVTRSAQPFPSAHPTCAILRYRKRAIPKWTS